MIRPIGRRVSTTLALAAVLLFGGITVGEGSPVEAAPSVADFTLPTVGPLGPISVIGDSVLLGHGVFSPTLPDQLVARGWGPVRFRGGVAISAGNQPVQNELKASYWIDVWRSQGWDAPAVMVNIGANDSGFCGTDIACARTAIMHLVDAIGPGKQIWWPMITRLQRSPFIDQQNNWNAALAQIASERDDFFTWDWPNAFLTGGFSSSDGVHLSPSGYRQRSVLIADQLTADMAVGRRVGGDTSLPAPSGPPSTFLATDPERIIDTRDDPPGRRPARSNLRLDLAPYVPDGVDIADVTAAAVQVTAAGPATNGYLAAHDCSASIPTGSSVNYTAGQSRGAMTISPLAAGELCIYAHSPTDVVVDLQGLFINGDDGAKLEPVVLDRLVDTRVSGRSTVVRVATPPGAEAVAVTLTATGAGRSGNLRAYPCDGTPPTVSNTNFGPGESVASAAFVPTGAGDELCVAASSPVDVVIDLTGQFRVDSDDGLAYAAAPSTRTVDTRDGAFGWAPVHGAGQTIDALVAPPGAKAVSGTLTMVRPVTRGFTTAFECGPVPTTSSVNAPAGVTMANSVTTAITDEGRLCLYTNRLSQTVFDTTGWWVSR
ncbi:MAG: SGNH/GDSL hydrolase family protein [Actinomycetota bacterium]